MVREQKHIYLNKEEQEIIIKAANIEKRKPSEFTRLAVLEKAKEVLNEKK